MRILFALVVWLWVAGVPANAVTNAPLRDLQIVRTYGVAASIFDEAVNLADLQKGTGYFLQTTIDHCRKRAAELGKSPSSIGSLGGSWLEYAVLLALKNQNLVPAYWQAEFTAVPKNFNDVLLWSQEFGPVVLSCKTSLRERYKQADLEAVALQKFFPKGKYLLITLDDDQRHLDNIRRKIAAKELLALEAIYAPDNANQLIAFLKTLTLTNAPEGVLHSTKTVR